jgi:hypothetical protein
MANHGGKQRNSWRTEARRKQKFTSMHNTIARIFLGVIGQSLVYKNLVFNGLLAEMSRNHLGPLAGREKGLTAAL